MYGSTKQNSSVPSSCSSAGVVPTVASKVAFPQELRGFNPGPHLPSPFREAYENLDGLLRSGIEGAPPAPIPSSKAELWQLFWTWDAVGRLFLATESEIPSGITCNLFRLPVRSLIAGHETVWNNRPQRRPQRWAMLVCFWESLSPRPGVCVAVLMTFAISIMNLKSRMRGPGAHQSVQRRRDLSTSPNARVYACFSGFSMGDHWAPAIAQVSHEEVLKSFGALRDEEHLKLGCPVSRAPNGHYSGVCIDDKLSLQVFLHVVPEGASQMEVPGRDLV